MFLSTSKIETLYNNFEIIKLEVFVEIISNSHKVSQLDIQRYPNIGKSIFMGARSFEIKGMMVLQFLNNFIFL